MNFCMLNSEAASVVYTARQRFEHHETALIVSDRLEASSRDSTIYTLPALGLGFLRRHLLLIALFVLAWSTASAADISLTITSDPSGANVAWNGRFVGTTPYTAKFPGGYFHETSWITSKVLGSAINIVLSKPGYQSQQFSITDGPYERRSVNGQYHGQFWIITGTQFHHILAPEHTIDAPAGRLENARNIGGVSTQPKDVDGWGGIRWGMTLAEARAAVSSREVDSLNRPSDDGMFIGRAVIKNVRIAEMAGEITIQTRKNSDIVSALEITAVHPDTGTVSDPSTTLSTFSTLRRFLIREYGTPKAEERNRSNTRYIISSVTWNFPSTTVTLQSTETAELRIGYVKVRYLSTEVRAMPESAVAANNGAEPGTSVPPSTAGVNSFLPLQLSRRNTIGGNPILTITNDSNFASQLSFSGAQPLVLSLTPHSSQTVTVVPGDYIISGSTAAQTVISFTGNYMLPKDVTGTLTIPAR